MTSPSVTPLDPVIADMQRRWKESGIPDLYEGGHGPVSRERARNVRCVFYPKPNLPQGSITPGVIPGPGGDIPVRVVRPVAGEPMGTVVYFHGGGWILGDLESHEAHAIRIANRCGVVVLNVDYRLAPEHKFPAAPDDAASALAWAHDHLAGLGGADKPLAVAGDSAGGNLAAVAAQHARAMGIALAAQLLIYPATDLSGLGDPTIRGAYFGDQADVQALDPRASPIRASTLAGLAPAIIGVGIHDFLYQDNLAYAAALKAAGVNTLLREYGQLNHGFFSFTAISKASEAAANQLCDDLLAMMIP